MTIREPRGDRPVCDKQAQRSDVWKPAAARARRGWDAACRAGMGLLAPPQCAACGAEQDTDDGLLLCRKCRDVFGPKEWNACPRCGSPAESVYKTPSGCVRCNSTRWKFDRVVSLGVYDGALRGAILRMKRQSGDGLSMALGSLYCGRRADRLSDVDADLVVPIPMHWTRRLWRGTNSAEIVAFRVARFLGVPAVARALVRCRRTLPQSHLPPSRRLKNVRGAFRVRKGHDISGARVILVDDILTTGATCSEAARVLKLAGAKTVVAAILARAATPGPS